MVVAIITIVVVDVIVVAVILRLLFSYLEISLEQLLLYLESSLVDSKT